MTWDDPLLWVGAYVTAGTALALNDLVTESAETRETLAGLPRAVTLAVAVVVLTGFVSIWPLVLVARFGDWRARRRGAAENESEEDE